MKCTACVEYSTAVRSSVIGKYGEENENMSNIMEWHNNVVGQRAVDALNEHNFHARYFGNRQEALDYVLQLIPKGSTIGVGGSRTGMEL